jgi:hypothetical protein
MHDEPGRKSRYCGERRSAKLNPKVLRRALRLPTSIGDVEERSDGQPEKDSKPMAAPDGVEQRNPEEQEEDREVGTHQTPQKDVTVK